MLKPDKNDPNYKAEMERFKNNNSDWGRDHTVVDVLKIRRAAGGFTIPDGRDIHDIGQGVGALKENDHPGAAAERVSLRLLTARGVGHTTAKKIDLVLPLAERLLAQANGDEHAVSFEGQEVQQYLQRVGL